MDPKEFLRLKDEIDRMKRDLARAEGALEQGLAQLQKEFDCKDEKEAQKLLDKLTKESERLKKKYDNQLVIYQEQWKEKLG